jgi:hypothetical protein
MPSSLLPQARSSKRKKRIDCLHFSFKNPIYSKHISVTNVTDMVLVMQNIMDISHIELIIEIENPVPKISLFHSEKLK